MEIIIKEIKRGWLSQAQLKRLEKMGVEIQLSGNKINLVKERSLPKGGSQAERAKEVFDFILKILKI